MGCSLSWNGNCTPVQRIGTRLGTAHRNLLPVALTATSQVSETPLVGCSFTLKRPPESDPEILLSGSEASVARMEKTQADNEMPSTCCIYRGTDTAPIRQGMGGQMTLEKRRVF